VDRDFIGRGDVNIYLFALAHGDLALAQEAAGETVDLDLARKPNQFYELLGADAFLRLVNFLYVQKKAI
jgi:hypothetical protein